MAIVISAARSVPTASSGKAMSASARLNGPVAGVRESTATAVGASGRSASTRAATRAFSSSRLARQGDEGAGRLVAGDLGRQRLDAAGCLDAIGEDDHCGSCGPASSLSLVDAGIMSILRCKQIRPHRPGLSGGRPRLRMISARGAT